LSYTLIFETLQLVLLISMTIVQVSIALAESVARWLDEGMPEVGTKEWSREEVDSFEDSGDEGRDIEDHNEDYAGVEEDEDKEDCAGAEKDTEDTEDKKTEDTEDHPLKEDSPHIEDLTAEEKPPAIILRTTSTLASSMGSLEPLLQAIAPTILYMPMPLPRTLGSPMFKDTDVIAFLERSVFGQTQRQEIGQKRQKWEWRRQKIQAPYLRNTPQPIHSLSRFISYLPRKPSCHPTICPTILRIG
jgi:hypothetical protein